MIAHEGSVVFGVSPPEKRTLYGSAGRAADNNASPVEHIKKRLVCERIEIGIRDAPLPSPIEEYGGGFFERGDECLAVGLFQAAGVENGDMGDAGFFFYHFRIAAGGRIGAGRAGSHKYYPCAVFTAGQLGKFLPDFRCGAAAADNDQRSFLRPMTGGRGFYGYG